MFHGYLVFASTFLLNFITVGQFNASSLYLDSLQESFPDSGGGTLAVFCTIQIVAGLASSLIGGIAQDALESAGIGFSWLFLGGGLFMFLGLVGASFAPTLMVAIFGSMMFGVGLGLAGFMSAGMCVMWFEHSRGTMLLLAISGQGLGNIFFPWLILKLLDAHGDSEEDPWRPTMRWMGLLSFIIAAIASPPMRLPFPGEVEENEMGTNTSDVMMEPLATNYGSIQEVGTNNNTRRRRSSVATFEKVRGGSSTQVSNNMRSSIVSSVASGLRRSSVVSAYQALSTTALDPLQENGGLYSLADVALSATNLWLTAFTVTACFASLNSPVLLPPYCLSLGFTEAVGAFAMTLYGTGLLLSNLTLGIAVDRFGARKVLAFDFVTMALLFFVWPLCVTPNQIYVVAFCFGYTQAPISSLPIIILADAFASVSPEHILTLNGITNMAKFAGYLLGPAIASSIAQSHGGYGNATALSGIIEVSGALFLLMIPTPDEQQRLLVEGKSKGKGGAQAG
jgi:MFS family permease